MNILDDNNSIRFVSFKCLDTERTYEIISSRSTLEPSEPHYKDKAIYCEDIVRRDDGLKKELMRSQLALRFTNIEEYKLTIKNR